MINIGKSLIQIEREWDGFILILNGTQKNLLLQFEEDQSQYDLYAIDSNIVYLCKIYKDGKEPSFFTSEQKTANTNARNDFESNWKSSSNKQLDNRDEEGISIAVPEPMSGDKYNSFSVNWCDKCSWYEGSVKIENEILTTDTERKIFKSAHDFWIDMTHGRITQEDWITANGMYIPIIMLDGEPISPDTASEGGYSIDYKQGLVIFVEPQDGEVTATYWYANSGTYTVKPPAGKKLKLLRVEIQFSSDLILNDTMIFQPFGYADVFAPQLGLPPGTLIPLQAPNKYKNTKDFINESNGSWPVIPAFGGPERGLLKDVIILVWEYLTKTEMYSTYGMEIRIMMETNTAHSGEYATATFYGVAT